MKKEYGISAYSIYQLDLSDSTDDLRFMSLDWLEKKGLPVDRDNYQMVYAAELSPGETLEDIYTRFNIDHPEDFKGHSLSVSDVVVLHEKGSDTAYYVDSIGFKEVPDFWAAPGSRRQSGMCRCGSCLTTLRNRRQRQNLRRRRKRKNRKGADGLC